MSTTVINSSLASNRTTSVIKSGGSAVDATTIPVSKPAYFTGSTETLRTDILNSGITGVGFIAGSALGDADDQRKLIEVNVADTIPGGNGLATSIEVRDPVITASGMFQDIDGVWRDSKGTEVQPPSSNRTFTRHDNVFPSGDRDATDGTIYDGDFHTRVGKSDMKNYLDDSTSSTQLNS